MTTTPEQRTNLKAAAVVKPLEWKEARFSDEWERFTAETIIGRYEVLKWSDGGYGGSIPGASVEEQGREFNAPSMLEAKAVAQADYERRILSVIDLSALEARVASAEGAKNPWGEWERARQEKERGA